MARRRGGGPGGLRLDEHDIKLRDVDPKLYRRMFSFIRPYLGRLVVGTVLMGITALTGLAGPYLLQVAIDGYIKVKNMVGLNLIAAALLVTALLNAASSFGQTYVVSWVGQQIIYDLRDQMFRHLQQMGLRFYDRMSTGRIMSRLISDVDAINQMVSSGLVTIFADSMVLVAIVITMLKMNTRLALVSFVTIPVLLLVLRYFKGRLRDVFMQVRRRAADMSANLSESISGIRVVQSFAREDQNLQEFDQINYQTRQANLQATAVWAKFFPAIEVVSAMGVTLVLWYGGVLIQGGAPGVTVGQVAAFILYMDRFFQPVRDLSQVYNVFQAAVVSAERVAEVLDQEPDVLDHPEAYELPPVRGDVLFEDVSFGYTPGPPILKHISLHAEPGQTIALVGPTGAGKSSIANLLARFYDPWQGRVLVDGHDLRQVTQESWRRQLGIVLQDTFLFTGTIRDNIRYGRPDASDQEVEESAKAVGAHSFIASLPQGYDTQVSERGAGLSVGQRQLIAFARALCADPAVLILDEATSDIDTYTEAAIRKALARLLVGRTVFLIAHRLSTVQEADRIYYIEDGQVVEKGTHQQLMEAEGRYAAQLRTAKRHAGALGRGE